MDLFGELTRVIEELERDGVSFALCGGLAVAVHGHPRATKDIDLLVEDTQVDRAKLAVKRAGFSLPALPMRFAAGTDRECDVYRVSKIVDGDPLTIDFVVMGASMKWIFDSREVYEWMGKRVVTVSREGLEAMKRSAGRPQDLADLDKLGLHQED